MISYKLTKTDPRIQPGIIRNDGLWIPINEQNNDYQEYLKWLAEGNTPEPADE